MLSVSPDAAISLARHSLSQGSIARCNRMPYRGADATVMEALNSNVRKITHTGSRVACHGYHHEPAISSEETLVIDCTEPHKQLHDRRGRRIPIPGIAIRPLA